MAVVVGSGIAAQRLSPHDVGLQLLENSLATALGLTVLILMLGPVSGAHFNPRRHPRRLRCSARGPVTARRDRRSIRRSPRSSEAIGGAVLANVMFATAHVDLAHRPR